MRLQHSASGLALALALTVSPVVGATPEGAPARWSATEPPDAQRASTSGRPTIVLDYLELPSDLANAAYFAKELRTILYRETRRVRWGAGTGSTITYRFYVTKLTVVADGDVVRVTCYAQGQLPKGKTAKSMLTFSGPVNERNAIVRRVLEIVARGVVTRLAELERQRRGDLDG